MANHEVDLVDKYYSTHYNRLMPRTSKEWDSVVERIEMNFGVFFNEVSHDSVILDVPCGVGYLEYYLLKKGYSNTHAVDLSKEQIQVAQSKLREFGLESEGRIKFVHADAFKYLKQHKKRFDAIAQIDFLEHLPKNDILRVLHLSHEALKQNGLLIVRVINAENLMWGRHFYHDFTHETPFTRDTLRQCLDITGFNPVRIDFEVLPVSIGRIRHTFRRVGLWFLGKLLGVTPSAFTENLIAVARKR